MFVFAQVAGQAAAAQTLEPEWILEVVLYSVLIIAGLALIFLSALGHRRLRWASGDSIIKIKDLFSLQTNLVGLFAVLGVLLIGAVLFMRFSDYRDKLKESVSENARLAAQLASESKEMAARFEELAEKFKVVTFVFVLEFPENKSPENPGDVNITAEVERDDGSREKRPVMTHPGPGGISASVQGLRPGNVVRLRATEGQKTWKSAPFVVPSVGIEMKGE